MEVGIEAVFGLDGGLDRKANMAVENTAAEDIERLLTAELMIYQMVDHLWSQVEGIKTEKDGFPVEDRSSPLHSVDRVGSVFPPGTFDVFPLTWHN